MRKGSQFVLVTAFIPWQDKVLVARRAADDDFLAGYWEMVGGKIDFGESPYAAIIREVHEEAGLVVKPIRPYFLFDQMTASGQHLIDIAFHCELIGKPEIVLSHEHQDSRWVAQDEIGKLMPMSDEMREVALKGFAT